MSLSHIKKTKPDNIGIAIRNNVQSLLKFIVTPANKPEKIMNNKVLLKNKFLTVNFKSDIKLSKAIPQKNIEIVRKKIATEYGVNVEKMAINEGKKSNTLGSKELFIENTFLILESKENANKMKNNVI